ncbi:MAG: hypothetical protein EOO02_22895 [Chitinophagaceae bacterium]|nr:MAG: hypothetical protein EOO02_22895 [Chitinophagaceae bacterium]
MFRNAGMNPVDHPLTSIEVAIVKDAFSKLPVGILSVLEDHLENISFMDSMPNTALTSPLIPDSGLQRFNITFRAGILKETISQWATKKENTLFNKRNNPGFEIRVNGGDLNALVYVLLHEATHVADAVLKATPHPDSLDEKVLQTNYTKEAWQMMNKPLPVYIDTLLERTLFRGGAPLDIELAPEIYMRLRKTPFPSLYGMASWFEDVAELETIYHLNKVLRQPFEVMVLRNNKIISKFDPLENHLVNSRIKYLAMFYQ